MVATEFQKFKLPLLIILAFIVAALWVGGGRLLFGVFGWVAFITLFMFAPIIFLYGTILAIVVAIKQRSYQYRKWGPFMIWLFITLGALFCVGFFMPDGGDTADSAGSAFSVVMLDRTNSIYLGISGVVAGWMIFVTVVSAVATFIVALFEKPKKLDPSQT